MRLSHGGDHGIEGRGGVPPEPQTAVSSPSRAEVHRRKRATVLSPRCPSPPRTQGSGRVFRARRAAPSGCAPLLPPSRSSHDGRDLRNPLPLILTPQLPSRPFSELVSWRVNVGSPASHPPFLLRFRGSNSLHTRTSGDRAAKCCLPRRGRGWGIGTLTGAPSGCSSSSSRTRPIARVLPPAPTQSS